MFILENQTELEEWMTTIFVLSEAEKNVRLSLICSLIFTFRKWTFRIFLYSS